MFPRSAEDHMRYVDVSFLSPCMFLPTGTDHGTEPGATASLPVKEKQRGLTRSTRCQRSSKPRNDRGIVRPQLVPGRANRRPSNGRRFPRVLAVRLEPWLNGNWRSG